MRQVFADDRKPENAFLSKWLANSMLSSDAINRHSKDHMNGKVFFSSFPLRSDLSYSEFLGPAARPVPASHVLLR